MSLLDVVSPDAAFRHAIYEQMAGPGAWQDKDAQPAGFVTLGMAFEAWDEHRPAFVLIDEAALDHDASRLAAFIGAAPVPLFVAGDAGESLGEPFITEAFAKPLRLGYLLARWQFHRQLQANNRDVRLTLGPWRFEPRARQLHGVVSGETVRLTDKETSLLEYLCRAAEPLSRDEILAAVWGYDGDIDTHTLETHITRLRRKLEQTNTRPEGDAFVVERGQYRMNPLWLVS